MSVEPDVDPASEGACDDDDAPDIADIADAPSVAVAPIVIAFVACVAVLLGGALLQTRRSASSSVSSPSSNDSDVVAASAAPAARAGIGRLLPSLVVLQRGKPLELAGPRKKPTLLHLWATWCGPCRAELPLILDYGRSGDVELIALSVDDEWPSVQRYFGDAMPDEVAWDAKIVVEPALGVRSLPTTFLIDTDGRLLRQLTGAHDWSDPALRASIQSDLKRNR